METTIQHQSDDHSAQQVTLDGKIAQFVNELLTRDDLYLVAVSVRGAKGSRMVEVFIDGDDGVSVSDLASLSRELAFVLEAEDVIKGKYRLNVSSPGDDRALLLERQYNRHKGKIVLVLVSREENGIWVEGENLGVNDGVLVLRNSKGTEEILLKQISKAKIKLPW